MLAAMVQNSLVEGAPTTPLYVAVTVGYALLFYWRIWVHLRDVAAPTL